MLLLWLALYMQSVIDVLLIRNQTNLVYSTLLSVLFMYFCQLLFVVFI